MSPKKFSVSEEAKRLVHDIITKNDLNPTVEVKYAPGSEVGDGYASQTVAVSIIGVGETLDLFLKCALKIESSETLPIDKLYANEIYFYDVVYPAYRKFGEDRGHPDAFANSPRCYGTSAKDGLLAMENLKRKGFSLFERNRIMSGDHIKLVFETFAKFHAISFAFKDQDQGRYDELVANTFDFLSLNNGESTFIKILRGGVKDFLNKLDPVADKEILDRCDVEDLIACVSSADRNLDQFSILTQGDCWCNNMMFLYQNGGRTKPIDMVLIDWQLLRPASPVFDISYFYLTVASEEILAKTEDYLKFYHDQLSKRIRLLGSDPELLYPFHILLKEWRRHCRFGFTMATVLIKVMLSKKDEAFNLEEMDFDNSEQLENLYPKFENAEEYLRRMRILAKYMIRNGYL